MTKTTEITPSNGGTQAGNSKTPAVTPATNGARNRRETPPAEAPKAWTFLTNHAHVLIVLYAEPGLVLREVAARVGITERAVQRIVQDLEEEGFIRREKVGRRNHYEVVTNKALRHPVESHRDIGDLIRLITG